MRIIIYFAVTRYDDRIYMTEQEKEKSQNRFVDMVDDIGDLKMSLIGVNLMKLIGRKK